MLQQNLEVARGFQPLSAAEMQQLRDRSRPLAADGRLELFKTTKKYDGDLGRQQHEFPLATELHGPSRPATAAGVTLFKYGCAAERSVHFRRPCLVAERAV